MKYLNLIILIYFSLMISSCGTVKEAFTNPKKNNSDEFLVEKKSPLAMPPDFNLLPDPDADSNPIESKETKIKGLITKNKNKSDQTNVTNTDKNLEKSLLEKIKKN